MFNYTAWRNQWMANRPRAYGSPTNGVATPAAAGSVEPTAIPGTNNSQPTTWGMQSYGGEQVKPGTQNAGGFGQMYGGMSVKPGTANQGPKGIMAFEDGGAIPDSDGDDDATDATDETGTPQSGGQVTDALQAVEDAFAYGRSKYGIGGAAKANQSDEETALPAGNAQSFDAGGDVEDAINAAGDNYETASGAGAPSQDIQDQEDYLANRQEGLDSVSSPTSAFHKAQQQRINDKQLDLAGQFNDEYTPEKATAGARREDQQNAPSAIDQAGNALQGSIPRFIAYLTQGAAQPDQVQQLEQQVDPQHQMSDGDRKLYAVALAHNQGGPQAAWPVAQYYKQVYSAYRNLALAALQGAGDRGPDLNESVQRANIAYTNMLDGTDLKFEPFGRGVAVTATQNGKIIGQEFLTTDQYKQFLSGPEGTYDNMFEKSGPAIIKQMTQLATGGGGDTTNGAAQTGENPQGPTPAAKDQQQGTRTAGPVEPVSEQKKGPSFWDYYNGSAKGLYDPKNEDWSDARIEALAFKQFPMVSQNAEREALKRSLMQQQVENSNTAARYNHDWQVESRKYSADKRYDAAMAANAVRAQGNDQRNAWRQAQLKANVARWAREDETRRLTAQQRNQAQIIGRMVNNSMGDPNVTDNALKMAQRAGLLDEYGEEAANMGSGAQQTQRPQLPQASNPNKDLAKAAQGAPRVTTKEEYDAIPKGKQYYDPKGVLRTKG